MYGVVQGFSKLLGGMEREMYLLYDCTGLTLRLGIA
jgi:hypothetical protein